MSDWYKKGFDEGHGRESREPDNDYFKHDGDQYDYNKGREDGERRQRINEELEKEGY